MKITLARHNEYIARTWSLAVNPRVWRTAVISDVILLTSVYVINESTL